MPLQICLLDCSVYTFGVLFGYCVFVLFACFNDWFVCLDSANGFGAVLCLNVGFVVL